MNIHPCPRLPALLAALAILASAPAFAGTFGDLDSMAAKFPKKARESQEGEILVRFKASVPQATRDAKHVQQGNLKIRELKNSGIHHVRISPDQTTDQAITRYRADGNVLYAEPNYKVQAMLAPNETTGFNLLWGMNNTGQTLGTPGADIRAVSAWDLGTGSNTLVVMVIDTGVDATHQDLAANIWVNPGEIAGNGIDDDGNGYIDDVHGIDFVNGDTDPTDDYGHGTHVAGTIGAVGNNGIGVVGVNWNVKIMPCKFLDATGNGSIADAMTCLDYAKDLKARGVNIVATNNSYGGRARSRRAMYDAIKAQRRTSCSSPPRATRRRRQRRRRSSTRPSFDLPNVISVAASDHDRRDAHVLQLRAAHGAHRRARREHPQHHAGQQLRHAPTAPRWPRRTWPAWPRCSRRRTRRATGARSRT